MTSHFLDNCATHLDLLRTDLIRAGTGRQVALGGRARRAIQRNAHELVQGGKTIGDASMASTTLALRFCDLHHEQKISSCPQCAIFSSIYILFMFIKSIKISNQSKTKAWAFTYVLLSASRTKKIFLVHKVQYFRLQNLSSNYILFCIYQINQNH